MLHGDLMVNWMPVTCRGSGTSFAAPHVAGVAAVYMSGRPDASPADLKTALLAAATEDALDPAQLTPLTPNRMLYNNLEVAEVVASGGPDQSDP